MQIGYVGAHRSLSLGRDPAFKEVPVRLFELGRTWFDGWHYFMVLGALSLAYSCSTKRPPAQGQSDGFVHPRTTKLLSKMPLATSCFSWPTTRRSVV